MTAILTDPHLRQCLVDIVEQANITSIIETGTHHGDSTLEFAKMVKQVMTIESDRFTFEIAAQNLQAAVNAKRVVGICADSAVVFRDMDFRQNPEMDGEFLFVLDAHWKSDWPLLAELQGINRLRAESGMKCVVFVDDFFVPDRPEFAGCYGGLKSDDSGGRESELIPCGYNEPFEAELDKFEHFFYPSYAGGIGYCVASDFSLNLGPNFKVVR